MAHLSLYVDPRGRAALHRSGYAWLALLALPLWALHRRLWLAVVVSSLATPLLHGLVDAAIELVPDKGTQGWLALVWLLGWSVLCGAFANRWHRRRLERAGYRLVATDAPVSAAPALPA